MHFYRHYNSPFTVFLHSFHEILHFTAYFDRILGAFYDSFTRSRDDDVTSKMEVIDRLAENINFLIDYSISRFVFYISFT